MNEQQANNTNASWTNQKVLSYDFLQELFPGTPVRVGTEQKHIIIRVRPVTLADMQEFQEALTACLLRSGPAWTAIQNEESNIKFVPMLAQIFTPFLLTDLLGLVNRCCDHDIKNLPHFALADIIDAWLMESFGEPKKSEPWKALLTNLTTAFKLDPAAIWKTLTTDSGDGDTDTTKSSDTPSGESAPPSKPAQPSKVKNARPASKT